jgi:hypothetical protein
MADSIFVIVSEDTAVQISAGAGGERQIQSPTDNVEFLVRRAKARFSVGRKFRRAIVVPAHSTRSGREVNESAEASDVEAHESDEEDVSNPTPEQIAELLAMFKVAQ